jgi:lysophospholipase L1-like esterase
LAVLLLAGLLSCAPTQSPSPAKIHTAPAYASTYVAIGASDAFGIGTDDPDRQSWPTILAELLGPGVHLVNLGIPGEVVPQALQMELPVALAANPNLVTVWLAVNDLADGESLAEYSGSLRSLLMSLRRGTHAQIFVGNIPDLTLLPHFFGYDPHGLRAEVDQWNAAIASICSEVGAHLVDIHSAWADLAEHPEYISADGFHPSAAGARQLARYFDDTIKTYSAASAA